MKTIVVGGGAAGFFAAVNLKEMCPAMQVVIVERQQKVLQKVLISGGGRCNCTNSFEGVSDLSQVYPRGHRLLKRLFNVFDYRSAYEWFESRGVPLVTQEDHCVFPKAQDSRAIADCLTGEARRLGVEVRTGTGVASMDDLSDYDYAVITTGGQPSMKGLQWITGHDIVAPVPSLFTLSIDDTGLRELMGTVVTNAQTAIAGTKFKADGALLITHWGVSGPAVLRLSSYAARHLADNAYRATLTVNWLNRSEDRVRDEINRLAQRNQKKLLPSIHPEELTTRLWTFLLTKALGQRANAPCGSLNAKEINRVVNTLTNDTYQITGRAAFKDEFVTCGGVALSNVNPNTLESRHHERLFFAGEVLDIDGVTGGFNFQAAWTTAYTVAKAIAMDVANRSY